MEAAIVLLPLLGAILAGFFGKALKDLGSQIVTCGFLVIAAILSWIVFFDVTNVFGGADAPKDYTIVLFTWVASGDFVFDWALKIDSLTAVMLVVVTTVSAVVHVYSIGYMHHDPHNPRFFAYLSFFTFAMLTLVTADNLVQMFFGWEGVGVASYLLIGFWYKRPSANAAAIKAFLVNRVGDFGFALGIFAMFVLTDSVHLDTIFNAIPGMADASLVFLGMEFHAITVIALLLFMGAMGKSAQLGLHTWLPDAMEGPTPVSALIHAATMVTAGVFMVCRLSPVFEFSDVALTVVTVVGATTAFFAATVGLTQNDIKRVIAYSTCSQLGYMFFAAGVSAYPVAMFHLMTHAFFKALLFLGAGSVIHAMSDEQDMRRMGGLAKMIPITYAFMWIGSLALMGIGIPGTTIGFAGFHSKDLILESAYAAASGVGSYAFWLGVTAAFMTAFYSGRLLFMTFHGAPRCDEKTLAHVHESPKIMWVPLVVLVLGSLFAGAAFYYNLAGTDVAAFWGDSIFILDSHQAFATAREVPFWVKSSPLVVGLAGFGLSYLLYVRSPDMPARIAGAVRPLYLFSLNKWYFDELYNAIFVKPSFAIGRIFWKGGDQGTIDAFGPDGVSETTVQVSKGASFLQTGYVYHYAFVMLIGVVIFVSWYVFFS